MYTLYSYLLSIATGCKVYVLIMRMWLSSIFCLFLGLLSCQISQGATTVDLNTLRVFELVGLFTTTDSDPYIRETYGIYPREAVRLAVEHVREEGLLDEYNYQLKLFDVETVCDQAGAVIAALEFIRVDSESDANIPYALVGPVCSVATGLVAAITSRYTSTVQVSYGVMSPLFSDVNSYPFLYRTVPAYTEYIEPITAILEYFDWQVVGIIVQTDGFHFTLVAETLTDFLGARNRQFEIPAYVSLNNHLRLEARNLGDSVRIFIAMVELNDAADTLCAAFQSGLTGSEFVWILLGDFVEGWWRSLRALECSEEEMLSAIESIFILTNSLQTSRKDAFTSIRRQNQTQFWDNFSTFLNTNTGLDFKEAQAIRVLPAYDAVWSITNALTATLAEESNSTETLNISTENPGQFESTRQVQALHKALNKNMKKLSFQGTSGEIKFTKESNSPQHPVMSIFQMQNGSLISIGINTQEENGSVLDFTFFGNNLTWLGEGPPRDRPVQVFQVVELWIIVIMLILAALGIVYATVIFIINCHYRKHKVIKASSPYINIVVIVGCILGLLIIPVISIENLDVHQVLPELVHSISCNLRPWMAVISLTLSFGALFAKTWRVYMIFRNPWVKARLYKDHVLLCIVGALLLLDVFVLVAASSRIQLRLLTYTFSSLNTRFTQDVYRICLSGKNILDQELLVWLIVVILMKLLLFLFGVFLVVQTSKIKAKFFQDSKFIGIAIYATVVSCGLGVPLSLGLMFLLEEDIGFVCSCATILFCSFFILSAVFLPRFALLRKYKKSVPTAVLLGLNPSFKIRRSICVGGFERKRSVFRTSASIDESLLQGPMSTTNLSSLHPDSTNAASVNTSAGDLLDDTNNRDAGSGWEPAYDDQEDLKLPITVIVRKESQSESPYLGWSALRNVESAKRRVSKTDRDSVVCSVTVNVQVHSTL